MPANHASAVAMAARHGRLLLMHLALAFLVIGLAAAYWFLAKTPAETAKVRDLAKRDLVQAESQVSAQVAIMETLTSALLSSVRDHGSAGMGEALSGLPPAAVDVTGLIAASWWPDAAASRPQYWYQESGRWNAHSVDRPEVTESIRQKLWFAMAPELGILSCLWSNREREAVTGEMVISCSRSFSDPNGRQLGVLRSSYRMSALLPLLQGVNSNRPLMLVARDGELLGGNNEGASGLRSLADVGQQSRELAPLMTALHDEAGDALRLRMGLPDFPPAWVSKAETATGLSAVEVRPQIAAAWNRDTYAPPDVCVGSECAYSQALRNAPWFIVRVAAIPAPLDIANGQISAHMPLLIFAGLVLIAALINYMLSATMFLRPLSRLVAPLSRQDVGPVFDDGLGGVWGQLAHHINELASRNQQLRGDALVQPRANAPKASAESGESALSTLPLAALRIAPDGQVRDINLHAEQLLGLARGADSHITQLTRQINGVPMCLAELPGEWRGELCRIHNDEGEHIVAVSSELLPDNQDRVIVLGPASISSASRGQATTSSSTSPAKASQPHTQVRIALAALTSPVHWLVLQVAPELVSPALTDPESKKQFEEQLLARIEERLENGESLIRWSRERYVIIGAPSISAERAEALRNDLQRTLIFLASERVRLKASTFRFSVRPRMSSQDFDAAVFAAQSKDAAASGATKRPSYDPATLVRLINQGFTQKRYQLITEHGTHPGARDSAPQVFRVLPHLEDDEGFWMGADAYLPALGQMDRRGEHDTWLVEAVNGALHALGAEHRPEQVLLPLSAKSLGSSRFNTAEKLTALARDPALTETRIFVVVDNDECVEEDVDLMSCRHLIQSLGCQMAISNVSLDTQAMAQLERVRPDMMIVREALVAAALDSPTIGIGLESLMRAGEKLKCLTVLPAINTDRGTQLVDKLRPTLAFGFAIGKPSPLPFRAVA